MVCLNGQWETGLDRKYTGVSNVPGLVYSATEVTYKSLWYKKEITLPDGEWKRASLILYGAKYMPEVYVNGERVSCAGGGLTVTRHLLCHPDIKPGNKVTIEIKLASLTDVPDTDASKLPKADAWRSDVSSHIWNDIYLDVHNDIRVDSMVTSFDEKNNILEIRYKTQKFNNCNEKITFTLYDGEEKIAVATDNTTEKGICKIALAEKLKMWSCDEPNLYTLETSAAGAVYQQKIGLKTFKKNNLGFELNGNPITLRMSSICWHRWQRDEQASKISYDENWFLSNVLLPVKNIGGNTLRFHLGPVPERFIELCDEYGMLVQSEWSFFHSLEASGESLKEQWSSWLDITLKHASVCIVHPWNEVDECQEIKDARVILDEIMRDYPQFILSHKDTIHLHKYWWSMFENVGLYYDNKEQFENAVIADEFGGNYLDYKYNPGGYPEVVSGLMRFLGEENTVKERVWLQNVTHAKIAEYWRRLGVAGFSPFCMISGPEDGNTYYEGDLREGKFKPVWNELKAAYMPVSVSMNVWDRNYYPGQETETELYLFNDTGKNEDVVCSYGIIDETNEKEVSKVLDAYSRDIVNVTYKMPETPGEYTMYATVGEAVSKWDIIVTEINTSGLNKTVGILECETELAEFFEEYKISYTNDVKNADIIIGLRETYNLIKNDNKIKTLLESALNSGISVALLGVGPQILGEGYKSLQERRVIREKEIEKIKLMNSVNIGFKESAEPESCVHQAENCSWLWENINKKSTWLWNGLRGGLIVPAVDMAVLVNDKDSFEKLWQSKRADTQAMKESDYYAYELEGFYEYSERYDEDVKAKLKERVKFLVDDAPSLQGCVNPDAEITVTNLYEEYKRMPDDAGEIKCLDAIRAGKSLLRTPAVMIEFAEGKGNLFISQMMFDGRLANKSNGFFELRNDPAARQMLINIIKNIC